MFTPPLTGSSLLLNFTDNQMMTCNAEGGPRLVTTWRFNNGVMTIVVANGSDSATYNISSSSTNDAGTYYCVATIDGRNDTSATYSLIGMYSKTTYMYHITGYF